MKRVPRWRVRRPFPADGFWVQQPQEADARREPDRATCKAGSVLLSISKGRRGAGRGRCCEADEVVECQTPKSEVPPVVVGSVRSGSRRVYIYPLLR